tara:strand:+ start:4483 stop:5952 length:1470 start_codon:yes stop_codon:yes gene_type:complete
MSKFIEALESSNSTTANGCVTHSTSSNPCVDLFFQIGAGRSLSESEVKTMFDKAFGKSPSDAMKILFYARDIRGGQGERSTFRTLINHAAINYTNFVRPTIKMIPFYGRWDDVFCLFDTPLEKDALNLIKGSLNGNTADSGLCAKWMPREKSSKKVIASKIRKHMGISSKDYRKLLVSLTSVVESKMCSKHWDSINYEKVPSSAMKNYGKAFLRNDKERFNTYVSDVSSGVKTINSSTLYPHELIKRIIDGVSSSYHGEEISLPSSEEISLIQAQWDGLPNYLMDNPERILPVVDTSGSMYHSERGPTPICVSIALGLYIAERNNGPFKDCFITFSESPELQKVFGQDIFQKAANLSSASWGYNTDIHKVFETILSKAVSEDVFDYDMPSTILILSDMQFDMACKQDDTAMKSICSKYEEHGYTLPKIVFWNLNSSGGNYPVKFNEDNTALISGFNPSIMKSLLSCGDFTPTGVMREVIDSERYSEIKV